jgi:hypothetical protein
MAMIVAHEWYREHGKQKAAKLARAYARDAAEEDAAYEIIYERDAISECTFQANLHRWQGGA